MKMSPPSRHPVPGTAVIEARLADITTLRVDAVCNSAGRGLRGGGGVDGMIHRKAGPELLRACKKLGFCDYGEAEITWGYTNGLDH